MADLKLSDGREITFDLSKITYGQWLGLFDPKESEDRSDMTIARVAGLSFEELKAVSYLDYRRITEAFFRKAREPLADPNSQSASISA